MIKWLVKLTGHFMIKKTIKDPFFRLEIISATTNPQTVVRQAMHQDYLSESILEEIDAGHFPPKEKVCGDLICKYLLEGKRGHYGPFEHPQLVIAAAYFPHSAMQQIRTHRNISMDVQSFRYTGKQIALLGEKILASNKWRDFKQDLERLFYFRPLGVYKSREGGSYNYTSAVRDNDLAEAALAAVNYYEKIDSGCPYEHARGSIPFDVRQHWVMSGNARSIMHMLDMRGKRNAQAECVTYSEYLFDAFGHWMPEVAEWYKENRWRKGILAP